MGFTEVPSRLPIAPTGLMPSVHQDVPLKNRGSDTARPHNEITCRYFQAGYCRRGRSCPFSHCIQAKEWNELPHKNKPQFPVPRNHGFLPEQPPPYYTPTLQILPCYLWSPPSYTTPTPLCSGPHESLHTGTAAVDYTSTGTYCDSEVSSMHTSAFNKEICTALEGTHLNDAFGGSPVPSAPVLSYRPGIPAVAPYRDPAAGPSPDWMSYLTCLGANNTDWCGTPSIFTPSHVASYQDEQAKRKPFAYRTKPCRFFSMMGRCSSGDKCTFIHGAGTKKTQQPNPCIADSPVPKHDDGNTENFYPITWRVIGGGVMMGGERKTCEAFVAGHCQHGDDCKFAHETEVETDKTGYLELKPGAMVPANRDGVRTPGASDKPDRGAQEQAQTPGQIASRSTSTQARPALLEPLSTELLDTGVRDPEGPDKAGGLKHSISTGLPHRRTRSMVGPVSPLCVVPSTTPATHFSAEF